MYFRCSYDALTIYDGLYGQQVWNQTDKICRRSQIRQIYTSSGNQMKLNFKTDRSVTRQGFKIVVHSICGGYLFDRQGVITSPNFAQDSYDNNLDCLWGIRTRPGRTFTFW